MLDHHMAAASRAVAPVAELGLLKTAQEVSPFVTFTLSFVQSVKALTGLPE